MESIELTTKTFISKIDKSKNTKTILKDLPAFDMSLIGSLESDHVKILDLFYEVLLFAKNKDYKNVHLSLVDFAAVFTDHIQVEDDHLYTYLKILASTRSQLEQRVVSNFSSEMKDISISISTFLTQSAFIPVNENNVDLFIEELQQIEPLLLNRISREEEVLYPIYKNSQKVVNIS